MLLNPPTMLPVTFKNAETDHHGGGAANTHIHHHYHHSSDQVPVYSREETEFQQSQFLDDNNQVKRNTEGFVPMEPNFGGESSSSISGFRFPRERCPPCHPYHCSSSPCHPCPCRSCPCCSCPCRSCPC